MSIDPNGNGAGPMRGTGWFRLALLTTQIIICLSYPATDILSQVFGWGFQWTPTAERIYIYNVVASMILLGLLRAPQIIETLRLWRGTPKGEE